MAIDPSSKYPGQIDTSDPTGYPHGKAQNELAFGARNGTPLEKDLVNDIFGSQQALLAEVAATPSGTPDKVGASQYLDAIKTLISNAVTTSRSRFQASNWRMAAWDFFGTTTVNSGIHWIPEGVTGNGSWFLFGNLSAPANIDGRLPCSIPGGALAAANGSNPPLTVWSFTTCKPDGSVVVVGGHNSSSPDTTVATSTDFGVNWTSRVVLAAANWFCNGLVYDKTHNVYIFTASSPFGTLAPIFTSPAAATPWTQRANPSGALAGANVRALFVGDNGEACIISSDGKFSVSTDGGATWSAFVTTPITGVIKGAYTSTYGWVLIGTTQIAKTATLAAPSWTISAPFGSGKAVDIASDGASRYIVAHSDVTTAPGPGVQVSYDGAATWDFQRFDAAATTDYVPKAVKYNGAQWAVLGAPVGGGANTFAVWLSTQVR